MPHVEEELINFPEHLSSSSFCSSVLIARSLVFCEILCRSLFVIFPFAIALFVFRPTASDYFFGNFKLLFRENRVDIFNVCAINLITLSKPSTQILTKAISNIVKLYIRQVFAIKVVTSYRCCERLVSFKPSPEWDVITATAMHIKLSRNKKKSV